jgi:hypothetical protein
MAKDTHQKKYEGKYIYIYIYIYLCQSPISKEGYPGGAHWSTKVNDPQAQSKRSPKTNL